MTYFILVNFSVMYFQTIKAYIVYLYMYICIYIFAPVAVQLVKISLA